MALWLLFEHDLFGKPVPTFPGHALGKRPSLAGGLAAGHLSSRLFAVSHRDASHVSLTRIAGPDVGLSREIMEFCRDPAIAVMRPRQTSGRGARSGLRDQKPSHAAQRNGWLLVTPRCDR